MIVYPSIFAVPIIFDLPNMKERIWRNEHIYAEFDRIIRLFEKKISGKLPVTANFSKKVIEERVTQRLVQLLFYPFCILCTRRLREGKYPVPGKNEKVLLNKVTIDSNTGKIGLNTTFILIQVADFFWEWIGALGAVIRGYFNHSQKWKQPVTLVFGIGLTDINFLGEETPFIKFCKEGPIKPLVDAEMLVIQAGGKEKSKHFFLQYTNHPVFQTIEKTKLGFMNRSGLLVSQLLLPFRFGWMVMQNKLSVVLAKDIVQAQVIASLDEARLIQSVIITNSLFFQQYLWMRQTGNRSFKVHELHYSQNTIPIVYKDDSFVSFFPAFRHVCVDEHWVWTEGYAKYLQELGHKGPIHIVGPILWYLPAAMQTVPRQTNDIKMLVFDIPPVTREVADKLGIINYYYSCDHMIRFIEDIIAVSKEYGERKGKNVKIYLKSKRDFRKNFHDEDYAAGIRKCEEENTNFKVMDASQNLFSLLNECDLSVSIPYTTVPYIAAYLRKPAIYFDPGGELEFTNESSPYLYTASGKQSFALTFEKILSS